MRTRVLFGSTKPSFLLGFLVSSETARRLSSSHLHFNSNPISIGFRFASYPQIAIHLSYMSNFRCGWENIEPRPLNRLKLAAHCNSDKSPVNRRMTTHLYIYALFAQSVSIILTKQILEALSRSIGEPKAARTHTPNTSFMDM